VLATWRDNISAKLWQPKEANELLSVNHIRKKYGLAPLPDFLEMVAGGDYTLYPEPVGFIPTKPLPTNHFFLGPILWSPRVAMPSWWETWDPKLPIIYLTLGSTGVVELLPKIIAILHSLPVTIIVATAGRIKLKNMPKNVFAASYLPGLELCKLASLVICSGGSATAYQALSQASPVVGLWSNLDQYLTMMMIEQAGAGICYAASTYQPHTLKEVVAQVLQGAEYRSKAGELAAKFGSCDARRNFRQFVSRVINNYHTAE
jgi:UDP:flavonoid glycosyltransferase YjiC (YdhE family)